MPGAELHLNRVSMALCILNAVSAGRKGKIDCWSGLAGGIACGGLVFRLRWCRCSPVSPGNEQFWIRMHTINTINAGEDGPRALLYLVQASWLKPTHSMVLAGFPTSFPARVLLQRHHSLSLCDTNILATYLLRLIFNSCLQKLEMQRLPMFWMLLALLSSARAQGNRFKFTSMESAIAESQRLHTSTAAGGADLDQTWAEWKAAHGKTYASTDDEARGKAAWIQNVQIVTSHNLGPDSGGSSWLEPNRYADLTFKEFSARYLMQNIDPSTIPGASTIAPGAANSTRHGGRKLLASLPTDPVDMSGYATPVKDQGGCGSCWAFAAVATAESAVLKAKGITNQGNTINLSEQQIVNCVIPPTYGSNGCNGGWTTEALSYMTGSPLVGESDTGYPSYNGGSWPCSAPTTGGPIISSWGTTAIRSATAIITQLKAGGPLAIYINANSKFQLYSGGILPLDACQGTMINHAVTIVGYGIGASGTKKTNRASSYFNIKNSWGTGWGEAGYIRIAAAADGTAGACNMFVHGGMHAVAPP